MQSFKQIVFWLLLSSFSFISLRAQENTSYFLHTIEKGQNIHSISSMYNVSTGDIIRLNPGCEDKIYAGQTLKIPQTKKKNGNEIFHTIRTGETLYKLTTIYNVSAKDICDANPGLSAENFKAGQVIRIPSKNDTTPVAIPTEKPETSQIPQGVESQCREIHKVKSKETIFNVSRQYGITEQELIKANPELKDGMKKGQLLCIPYLPKESTVVSNKKVDIIHPSNRELFDANRDILQDAQATIKAAVILPFLTQGERKNDAARMVEYYEGFLLAVDSIKRGGTSVDLYVYDSGNENASINTLLAKEEMKQMDIIFGPLYQQHIKPLTAFTNKHNIRLVIPILKDDEVFQSAHVYQINTPQSYLYSEVYEHFTRQFPNANVIILDVKTEDKDKAEFIDGLKAELKRKSISVQVSDGTKITQFGLTTALQTGKTNIFIPTSGSAVTLNKIIPQLKLLVRNNSASDIHLFGYPEWQTYTSDYLESFFELDTYFYSSFYTNNLLPAAINFTNSYRKWYSKEMMSSYPKYGMLGFDTGLFFLSGLAKYGTGLENNLSKINLTPIQTGFKFERVNNWGGFINKKVFFVHYTKDFELIKLDFE